MSICFIGHGSVILKDEKANDFADKFKALLDSYDKEGHKFNCGENGYLTFRAYVRHGFVNECEQLIEDNIDSVEAGRLWFECHDEDGSIDSPFPFTVLIEITNGKVFEETLHTRVPYDWDIYYARPDIFPTD